VVTEGLIGQQFPQVFLIAHRHAFDPASFRYTLRMEDGAVAVSTLPGPHEAAQQWDGVAVAARARATNA
jgi:hypothetical protein